MRDKKGRFRTLSEINVTPFVDVMLVLLVIFMITAPLLVQGLDVHLPEAVATPLTSQDDALVLTIQKDRKIYLEKKEVPLSSLTEKLKAIYENRADKDIFLKADREVPYGFVVQVFSEMRRAGLHRIGVVTQPPEKR